MSDSSEQLDGTSASGIAKLWGALLVLAPVLYFLSVGPASIAYENTASAQVQSVLETIYHPLAMLYDKVPLIQPVFDGYMGLWI